MHHTIDAFPGELSEDISTKKGAITAWGEAIFSFHCLAPYGLQPICA
jgi:hypothetical protein